MGEAGNRGVASSETCNFTWLLRNPLKTIRTKEWVKQAFRIEDQ